MTAGLTLGVLVGQDTPRDRRKLLALAVIIMGAAVGFTGSRGGLCRSVRWWAWYLFRVLAREDLPLPPRDASQTSAGTGHLAWAVGGIALLAIIFSTVLFLGGNDQLLRSTGVDVDRRCRPGVSFGPSRSSLPRTPSARTTTPFGLAYTRRHLGGTFRVERAHNEYYRLFRMQA